MLDAAELQRACASPAPGRRVLARTSRACTRPAGRRAGRAVERLGVRDLRDTPVTRDPPARGGHAARRVRARWVVRATEGYTAGAARVAARARAGEQLDDRHRAAAARPWAQIGWDGLRAARATRRTCTSTCSAPPTGASRSAGAASPTATARGPTAPARSPHARSPRCAPSSAEMFPAAADVRDRARLGGVLGVPRDWCPSVAADRASRAGLGGRLRRRGRRRVESRARTLRDLILGDATPSSRSCRGWGARRAAGSPSRCAGSASAASTRSTGCPTARARARPPVAAGAAARRRGAPEG